MKCSSCAAEPGQAGSDTCTPLEVLSNLLTNEGMLWRFGITHSWQLTPKASREGSSLISGAEHPNPASPRAQSNTEPAFPQPGAFSPPQHFAALIKSQQWEVKPCPGPGELPIPLLDVPQQSPSRSCRDQSTPGLGQGVSQEILISDRAPRQPAEQSEHFWAAGGPSKPLHSLDRAWAPWDSPCPWSEYL